MRQLGAAMLMHQDELRADLQRVYHIDLDHAMGGEHTAGHVAALVSCLPSDSSLAATVDDDARWTVEACVLADVRNLLAGLIWGMGDKRRRGSPPKPIGPSWMTKGNDRTLEARVLSIEELMRELGKPRKGAENGG